MVLVAALLLAFPAAQAAEVTLSPVTRFGHRIDRGPGQTNFPSNLDIDQNTGEVYVKDLLNNRVQRFDADGRYLSEFPCNRSLGLAWDEVRGVLWVAARYDDKVRKYDQSGNLLLAFGGGAGGALDYPQDVAVHPTTQELYVLDTNNTRVVVFDGDGVYQREFSGDWQKTFGIEFAPDGSFLVISESGARSLLKYDPDGTLLARWDRAGSGPGQWRWPRDIAVAPDGNIYVADTDNERAQIIDSDGIFIDWVLGPNTRQSGEFHPRAIALNESTGDVYAAAAYSHRIDRFDRDGRYISSFGERSRTGPKFSLIKGVAVDPRSGDIFVSDWLDHRIKRFTHDGRYTGEFDLWIDRQTDLSGNALPLSFPHDPTTRMWIIKEDQGFPSNLAIDAEGNIWVTRGSMHYDDDPRAQADWLVRRFTPQGEFLSGFGHPDFPRNATVRSVVPDPDGAHVYVANSGGDALMKFTTTGDLVWTTTDLGGDLGSLDYPVGIALDPVGGRIYVTDVNNDRVVVLSRSGVGLAEMGAGELNLNDFSNLAWDPHGYVFVADTSNGRVVVYDADGTLVTQAGGPGFGGFGAWTGFTSLTVAGDRLYVGDTAGYEVEVWRIKHGD